MKRGSWFSGWALAILAGVSLALGMQSAQAQQREQVLAAQPEQAPGGQVVAVVNDDEVTRSELQSVLQSRLRGRQPEPEQMQQLQEQALENLIESRLVEQYVLEEGPGADEQEVEQFMQQFQQQLEQQDMSLEEFLQSQGQSKEQFRKRIAGSIAWQKFQQEQVTPEKLQQFFQENQEQFEADSFEQAQQQVRQAYAGKLWNNIVEETKPEAEIEKKLEPQRGQPAQPQRRPSPSDQP